MFLAFPYHRVLCRVSRAWSIPAWGVMGAGQGVSRQWVCGQGMTCFSPAGSAFPGPGSFPDSFPSTNPGTPTLPDFPPAPPPVSYPPDVPSGLLTPEKPPASSGTTTQVSSGGQHRLRGHEACHGYPLAGAAFTAGFSSPPADAPSGPNGPFPQCRAARAPCSRPGQPPCHATGPDTTGTGRIGATRPHWGPGLHPRARNGGAGRHAGGHRWPGAFPGRK